MPRSVVPPGVITSRQILDGSLPLAVISAAVPRNTCSVMRLAFVESKPEASAKSCIASTK